MGIKEWRRKVSKRASRARAQEQKEYPPGDDTLRREQIAHETELRRKLGPTRYLLDLQDRLFR
jgi:hypothetical protein